MRQPQVAHRRILTYSTAVWRLDGNLHRSWLMERHLEKVCIATKHFSLPQDKRSGQEINIPVASDECRNLEQAKRQNEAAGCRKLAGNYDQGRSERLSSCLDTG